MIVNSFSFPSKVHRPSAFHNQFQLKTTLRELALSEEGGFEGKGGEGLRLRCSANSQAKDRKKMIKANHENISEVIIKHEKTLLYSSLQSMYCSDKFSA